MKYVTIILLTFFLSFTSLSKTIYIDVQGLVCDFCAQSIDKVFSLEIERIAKEKDITHMDAVLLYCKNNEIEPEKVSSLITKGLKEKIEANARELNFLPKVARLPI